MFKTNLLISLTILLFGSTSVNAADENILLSGGKYGSCHDNGQQVFPVGNTGNNNLRTHVPAARAEA